MLMLSVAVHLQAPHTPRVFKWGTDCWVWCCCLLQCGPSIKTYPWPAEDLLRCATGNTGFQAGEVERPSILKHPLFPLGLLAFIIVGGYAAWLIYNSPIVKITALWALGALAVYWFATSGGMYNIIRGVPLYYKGQNGKLVWWTEVRGLLLVSYLLRTAAVMQGCPDHRGDPVQSARFGGKRVYTMCTVAGYYNNAAMHATFCERLGLVPSFHLHLAVALPNET